MKRMYLGLALVSLVALAGCSNGPGAVPTHSPADVQRDHQREEALNEAQARADRMKSEVEMCQKTVEETHHLYEEAVAKAQQLYREESPVVIQAASDAVAAGKVWVQRKLDEHSAPAPSK